MTAARGGTAVTHEARRLEASLRGGREQVPGDPCRRLSRLVRRPWSGVLATTILRASWPSPGPTAGDLARLWT
jgi:hypothetical protein